ncbi:L,D-transpeptidase [Patescibacteria group bacterium]|nr:L,D-transpeptidase [Patescibacteria group bacterium]
MKFLRLLILLLILLLPYNLYADVQTKEIKVFSFQGILLNTVELKGLEWYKIGDIAVSDLGTDGTPEIIISSAFGEKPYIKIYRLNGSLINEFLVYPEAYLGGVNFEVADLDGNGIKEIITAATFGGGPHILVLNSAGQVFNSFFAFAESDRGGVNVATGNLYENQLPEIIVSSNNSNQVRVFNKEGNLLNEITLLNNFQHGQRVSAIDLGSDGVSEIITFANKQDIPSLFIYQNNGDFISTYSLYNQEFKGGVNLMTSGNQIFIGAGFGGGPHLKIIDGFNAVQNQFFTNEPSFLGGVKLAVYDNQIYTIPEQFKTAGYDDAKYILIDLSEQKLKHYQNGFLLGDNLVSTGKAGYNTPTGEFSVLNKSTNQYSAKYGLYMPYWMNFYTDYGIHELPYWPSGYREGEDHLGIPVSHGCVRLGIGPAHKLYNWAEIGTRVYIEE